MPSKLTHSVSLFAENKAVGVMKVGHAFTIEPMISEGKIFAYFYVADMLLCYQMLQ